LCRVAGNTVTLCDSTWQVTPHSSVMGVPLRAVHALNCQTTARVV